MGDRGNIAVRESAGQEVNFYTHDLGSNLPHIVRKALGRKERWDDPAYLARIVFCELVKGREREETGFGISPVRGDFNYPDIVIDAEHGTISYRSPLTEKEKPQGTFEQFLTRTEEQLKAEYDLTF